MELPFKPIGCGSLIEIIIRWSFFFIYYNYITLCKKQLEEDHQQRKSKAQHYHLQILFDDKENQNLKWKKCKRRLKQSSVDHNKYKCDDKDKYNWNRKKCKRRPRRNGVDRTCPAITITPMAFWPYGDNIDEDNPWKSSDHSILNHCIFRQCPPW